ncbi:MAG: hypothetical protein LBG27_01655 [Spirochaetaceae bacterium]|nr:hypothetical protein [Spirochaetaceae bacterium]
MRLARIYGHNVVTINIQSPSVYYHIDFFLKNEKDLVTLVPMKRGNKFGQHRFPATKREKKAEVIFFMPNRHFFLFQDTLTASRCQGIARVNQQFRFQNENAPLKS